MAVISWPVWQEQKGEGEGEKRESGEKGIPSLFPFLPIPYPFRPLLRRLSLEVLSFIFVS